MANELNIALAKSGLTVTAQRYQAGAAVGSAISCPETGTSGFYSGNMTGTAGTYQVAFISAGANVGSGLIVWDGTAEIAPSTLTAAQVNAEADTALADVGLTNTVTGRIDAAISSRLAPSGTLATVTNLTNAPASVTPSDIWSHATRTLTSASGPTVVQIREEMDSNSTKLANLDAAVSSRLSPSGTLAVVTTLTNAPTVPSVVQIRQEMDSNSTQLAAIKAKTDALPASPAAVSDIPSANISAIKAKTDLLETTRLAQCSTVATTGAQLAAALS
jgi:hypothetical protein